MPKTTSKFRLQRSQLSRVVAAGMGGDKIVANMLELHDEDGLGEWLKDKPVDWARAIAARCALRVFPLVFLVVEGAYSKFPLRINQDLIVSVWRATIISWSASKYPAHDFMAASAMAAAASAASAASAPDVVRAAAHAAAASASAVHSASAKTAAHSAARAAAHVTAAAVGRVVGIPSYANTAGVVWESIRSDCQYLLDGNDRLIEQPLWIVDALSDSNYGTNFPEWVREPFDDFANSDLARSSSWGLIVDWYRAILPNSSSRKPRSLLGEKADIEIATQPEEFWDREPDEVMNAIAEIDTEKNLIITEEDYQAKYLVDREHVEIPAQLPAPIETAIANNTVVRVHSDYATNRPDIEAIHAILVAEAAFLGKRIDRQAPDVAASINAVSEELGARLDDMRIYGVGYWAGVLNQIAGRIDDVVLDDAAGRFAGFLINLNLFLRHSEDWNAYIRTAQNAELVGLVGSEVQFHTPEIIKELTENPEIVAKDVSGPLASLNNALLDAPVYNPETIYGLYRSLANVLQAVVELSLKDGVPHLRNFAKDVGVDARKILVSWTAAGLIAACGSGLLVLAAAIPSMFSFLNPILRILGIG